MEYGKIPLSHRDNHVFHVAFYVCSSCMHFSGFIDTWRKKRHRAMPFFNDMKGQIRMRYVKDGKISAKILMIRKDPYALCIKCKKKDVFKIFARKRDENTYEYVGYVCKNCRIGYLISNSVVKFHSRDPKGHYRKDGSLPRYDSVPFNEDMGSFPTQIAEDEEKPEENYYIKFNGLQVDILTQVFQDLNLKQKARIDPQQLRELRVKLLDLK